MLFSRNFLLACSFILVSSVSLCLAAGHKSKTYTDPAKAGPDFAVQGEYVGTLSTDEGEVEYGAQIIARGDGKFHAVGFRGGLPGAGWDKSDKIEADGLLAFESLTFELPEQSSKAVYKDGQISVIGPNGDELGVLKKVNRTSPTMGAKPPKGAIVLFDGTTADNFKKGRIVDGGLLAEGVISKQDFADHSLHMEFRTPFMPSATGQARGNSGCYLLGRYEVQILDSFGLEGETNECGGIYKAAAPKVNMCLPPLSWQTYDMDFTAPKYADGKKVENAKITVRHNGVLIHEDLELPAHTPGGVSEECPNPGPLFLQDHHNPVRFRNIWAVPKK